MTAPLNITSSSGNTGAGTSSQAAGQSGARADGAHESGSGEFQSLLTALLDLLAAHTGQAGGVATETEAGAMSSNTTSEQTSNATVDLGGLIDLSSLLELKAQLTAEAGDTANASGGDGAETPDPLAAVLDLLIGALQSASDARPEGSALTLDGKSADALKALDALLASLADEGPGTSPTPLPADAIDKLKALDKLLAGQTGQTAQANQNADPELAELRTRIAELLGTSSEASKTASTDSKAPSAAALLGQDASAPKSSASTQRDMMANALEGARTTANPTGTGAQAGSGDAGGQESSQGQAQAQAQTARNDAALREQTTTGQDFAKQLAGDAADAAKKTDTSTDQLVQYASQGADRAQPSPARILPTAYTQQMQRLDVPQIAVMIARQASNGVNRFQIRLDPPEMGRIDVRLDLDKSGALHARLTVERPETLDLLQRDARALERALGQSGLDNAKTNLEFSLKQNPFSHQDSNQGQPGHPDLVPLLGEDETTSETDTAASAAITLYRGAVRPGGINMVA